MLLLDYVSILTRIRWLSKTALSPWFPKPEIVNEANSNMKSKAQNLPQLKICQSLSCSRLCPLTCSRDKNWAEGILCLQNHAIFLAISFCRFSTQQCIDFYVVVRLCFVEIPWDLFFLIFRMFRVFLYSDIWSHLSVFVSARTKFCLGTVKNEITVIHVVHLLINIISIKISCDLSSHYVFSKNKTPI